MQNTDQGLLGKHKNIPISISAFESRNESIAETNIVAQTMARELSKKSLNSSKRSSKKSSVGRN